MSFSRIHPFPPCRAVRTLLRGIALSLLGFGVLSSPSAAEVILTFGSYSPDKPSAMVKQLRPTLDGIARHMEDVLNEKVTIRLQIIRGYEDGVDLIVKSEVDFMRVGPASYVMAKDQNPGIQILAMEKKHGQKFFHGVICVREDSDITDVGQLRGRSFAFGNEQSTLGRYFAQLILMQNGIHAKDLSKYEYLGRHDKVGQAVGSGLYDAGALEETTFNKLVKDGVPIRAIVKVENATRPWVARANLDPRIQGALREAMLRMNDQEALAALRFEGFLPGEDTDYAATRAAIRDNPRFFVQSASKDKS